MILYENVYYKKRTNNAAQQNTGGTLSILRYEDPFFLWPGFKEMMVDAY